MKLALVRGGQFLGAIVAFALLLSLSAVLLLRWVDPPASAFMIEARMHARHEGRRHYRTHYHWVDLAGISREASMAVIAAEDQHFPFNDGFDFPSILEAIRAHEHGARLRGASTITQQVAKNLFLWSGRSFARKGLEAVLTVMIDGLWPKQRVLAVYLNIAQFGPGVYGVDAAARQYFHESASRLTRVQSALLAAVLPDPDRLHVAAPSPYVLSERNWIVGQIANLGGTSYLRNIHPYPGMPERAITAASLKRER